MALTKTITAKTKTSTETLTDLQARIDVLTTERIGAQKELELLHKQYDEKIEELKELGVYSIYDIPKQIEELNQQLQERIAGIETQVSDLEEQLGARVN